MVELSVKSKRTKLLQKLDRMTDLLGSDDRSIQHAAGVRRAHAAQLQLACSTCACRFQVINKPLLLAVVLPLSAVVHNLAGSCLLLTMVVG
jgi:predicted RecB family nuclease